MKCDKLTHEFSEHTQKIKMSQQASSGRGHQPLVPPFIEPGLHFDVSYPALSFHDCMKLCGHDTLMLTESSHNHLLERSKTVMAAGGVT